MSEHQSEDSYFVSMTDIMLGMLFVFILLVVYFAVQVRIEVQQQDTFRDDAANQRTRILERIREHLFEEGFTDIKIDLDQGILRLPEGVLFRSGVASIEPDSKSENVVNSLGFILHEILPCHSMNSKAEPFIPIANCLEENPKHVFLDAIFIEGHTDSVPLTKRGTKEDPKINTNLRLSARRSTNTYQRMIDFHTSLISYFGGASGAQILAVAAYGKSRPINDNSTRDERAQNRRIDLRLLMHVPDSTEGIRYWKDKLGVN